MRIKNKYLRNKAFRVKHWNRIRNQSHPFETLCPYIIDVAPNIYWVRGWDEVEQIKSHFEWIDKQSRAIENGTHKRWHHAPKHFRKTIWEHRKAYERNVMAKVLQGDYDAVFPNWKKDADWNWF